MKTLASVNATTGETTYDRVNETLAVGDRFRLIGRDLWFTAVEIETILNGTMPVVHGVSDCGRYATCARIEDTLAPTEEN